MHTYMVRLVVTLMLMVMGNSSIAHPHVWIYTDVEFHMLESKLNFIRVKWNFDEMYSSAIMSESDTNFNGKLEEDEQHAMYLDTFAQPEAIYPFMFFDFGNGKVLPKDFRNFSAYVEGDESLSYEFDVYFEDEISLSKSAPKIGFFDPSQYIAFEQSFTLAFEGDGPKCNASLESAEFITLSLGFAHPELYMIDCHA